MAESRRTLTTKDVNNVIARWYITTEMSLNYERMQSIAYTYALMPALKKLYPDKDIYLYINSPGGSVSSGLAIYDVMKYIKPKVITIGMGLCASMGAFLLSSGDKRYALSHTKIMIHQPLGGVHGQATDVMIVAEEIIKTKQLLKLETIPPKLVEKSLEINLPFS